jgi:aryl-alcohol dehydrogenase-like predicted oxidoreductase
MKTVPLGSQGLIVSAEGLGCMGMSAFYGDADEAESIATLHRALELGVTFLDTAEMYGPFKNEILLATALAGGKRDKAIIATKVGTEITDDGVIGKVSGKPDVVRHALDRSLKHLKTDYVDLYYLHRIDPETPIEDTVGTLADLVKAGKIRYIGVSEASPETLRKAHAVHPLSALQTEYSLFERSVESNGVLDTARELGIGFVSYSPLGRGLVAGTFSKLDDLSANDWRRNNPRFQPETFDKNVSAADAIAKLAAEKGVTASQLALAWTMAQGTVPIPGTKRRTYLEQNAAAAAITLTPDDLAAIDKVAPPGVAAGERYPPAGMASVNR